MNNKSSTQMYTALKTPDTDPKLLTCEISARSCILAYVAGSGFTLPPQPYLSHQNGEMLNQLTTEVESWNIPGLDRGSPFIKALLNIAVSAAELCFQDHEYKVRYFMSLISFFYAYIDDKTSKCPNKSQLVPFSEFQRRYVRSLPQLDPVLDRFASTINGIWDIYDDLTANFFISNIFEYVNGSCLENITFGMKVYPQADRYPYFLRSKAGGSQAFALLLFPKSLACKSTAGADPTAFIQAVPSISYWTDVTNDILSFYKEELAGETNNYVHLRAQTMGKGPLTVLQELVKEALDAEKSIEAILQGDCLAAWLTYKSGYISFHFTQKRYRLSELSLNLDPGPVIMKSNMKSQKNVINLFVSSLTSTDEMCTSIGRNAKSRRSSLVERVYIQHFMWLMLCITCLTLGGFAPVS